MGIFQISQLEMQYDRQTNKVVYVENFKLAYGDTLTEVAENHLQVFSLNTDSWAPPV